MENPECTTQYFYFRVHCSMLTTKTLVSLHHRAVGPFTHFALPLAAPPLVTTPVFCSLSVHMFAVIWFVHLFFVCLFFIFYI